MSANEPQKTDDAKDKRIAELTDQLKRTAAEFDNYQKRIMRERVEWELLAKAKILSKLLHLNDDLQRALHAAKHSDPSKLAAGVDMILKAVHKALAEEGVKAMDTIGTPFDPHRHEVMLRIDCDKDDGIIVQELERGYTLGDRVLRYAKVGVAKKTPTAPTKN